jgi:hypothetical protein
LFGKTNQRRKCGFFVDENKENIEQRKHNVTKKTQWNKGISMKQRENHRAKAPNRKIGKKEQQPKLHVSF